ncbi:uncharacterized protein J3D65DRAFT_394199 [Phyllosticta citribraziliensis]|uniref:Uncharacterized protein n=1 Tax=Phyllosticta citribraziliensis TaxID=989973 RepID=A0ABR1LL37_9PEZI
MGPLSLSPARAHAQPTSKHRTPTSAREPSKLSHACKQAVCSLHHPSSPALPLHHGWTRACIQGARARRFPRIRSVIGCVANNDDVIRLGLVDGDEDAAQASKQASNPPRCWLIRVCPSRLRPCTSSKRLAFSGPASRPLSGSAPAAALPFCAANLLLLLPGLSLSLRPAVSPSAKRSNFPPCCQAKLGAYIWLGCLVLSPVPGRARQLIFFVFSRSGHDITGVLLVVVVVAQQIGKAKRGRGMAEVDGKVSETMAKAEAAKSAGSG